MSEWLRNAGRYRINKGQMSSYEWWRNGVRWAWNRFLHVLTERPGREVSRFAGWGWKEPHSHIYLEYINEVFPDFKYIHVIRHGLDMAFSKQKEGVFLWGDLFGITPPSGEDMQRKMLHFWYTANKKVISWGEETMGDRFFLLNFERFCTEPGRELERLVAFLSIQCPDYKISELSSIPELPSSCGRYRDKSGIFSRREREMVTEFGYTVE